MILSNICGVIMKEGLNVEAVKKVWRLRLEKRLPLVEQEYQKLLSGNTESRKDEGVTPCVSDACPDKYLELAGRLVAIQTAKGEYKREDISTSDINKIKDIGKRLGVSFADAIAYLVDNNAFTNYDNVEAKHIAELLFEVDEIHKKYEGAYDAFPLNLISPKSRKWLLRTNNGLSNAEKLEEVFAVFRKDLANLKVANANYDLLPRSRQVLSAAEIERIKTELQSFANKDNNIDMIFATQNEKYFYSLCARLKATGTNLTEFLNNHTDYNISLCFKADILPTVREMVLDYYKKHGTFQRITTTDPYLRSKIEAAQTVSGCYSLSSLLEFYGIENDSQNKTARVMSNSFLKSREKAFFAQLQGLYPDGKISDKFSSKHDRLYDELALLAGRLKFASIDEYLEAHGFVREGAHKKQDTRTVYISQRDISFYSLLDNINTEQGVLEKFESLGLEVIDPYENLKVYRRLSLEKQDAKGMSLKVKTKDEAKKADLTKKTFGE